LGEDGDHLASFFGVVGGDDEGFGHQVSILLDRKLPYPFSVNRTLSQSRRSMGSGFPATKLMSSLENVGIKTQFLPMRTLVRMCLS
jgi:hypothetical protein